jgi:hypothetical protein
MKKVIVIEDRYAKRGSISDVCRKWPEQLEVIVSADEIEAVEAFKDNSVCLYICDLSSGYGMRFENLANLTNRFVHIPSIVIIEKEQKLEERVIAIGATTSLYAPVSSAALRLKVHEVLERSIFGSVRGISLHNILQFLESDETTCTLRISKDTATGFIYIVEGIVKAAEFEGLLNEEAMYAMLVWERVNVELLYYNGQRPHEIQNSLISMIIEAFRLKDERDNTSDSKLDGKPQYPIDTLTSDRDHLAPEMGAKIKMVFEHLDLSVGCTLVGMIQNEYLILSPPKPFDLFKDPLVKTSEICMRYIRMGRLCMFKTHLIKEIYRPHLLFLKYPSLIQFRELRRAKRAATCAPATLRYDGNKQLNGILNNLSSLGCQFCATVRKRALLPSFDVDSEVMINCFLPGIAEKQSLPGYIKNLQKSSKNLEIGVYFAEISDEVRRTIEDYAASEDVN